MGYGEVRTAKVWVRLRSPRAPSLRRYVRPGRWR